MPPAPEKTSLVVRDVFSGADNQIRTGDLVLTKERSRNTAKEKQAYISVQSVCYKPQYIV